MMREGSKRVIDIQDVGKSDLTLVGGKGASLGELSRIDEIMVPDGFCITTIVYKTIVGDNKEFNSLLDHLISLPASDRNGISETCVKIRKLIENIAIPKSIETEIAQQLERFGEMNAFAVRSSATAEDLPTASFAGQQDTYLNVIGRVAIIRSVSKCLASLFTDRAVIYRIQNGFDHRKVQLSVVVQKMLFPDVSGIMFTADPVTSNRKVVSIDASFGLGESLVSGLVTADNYKVSNGEIVDKTISTKKLIIAPLQDGGTAQHATSQEKQNIQALKDHLILQLEVIGRRIENHFGYPQDIEWCLVDDTIYVVQSRPITTLYPIPKASDSGNHVYISVGHQQMMTDAMKPLGLSFFLLMTSGTMYIAGGRLFVDVTPMLASSVSRAGLLDVIGKNHPLMLDALMKVLERGDFIKLIPADENGKNTAERNKVVHYQPIDVDAAAVAELIATSESSIEELKRDIQDKSGVELFDFIVNDVNESKKLRSDPRSLAAVMAVMNAGISLNENINQWLGAKNAADVLSQSVANNVTSEMGLALLDVADVIRPHPEVIDYLKRIKDDGFLDELIQFDGGDKVRKAILVFLEKYGMRCTGEIDITRPRWREKPSTLIPSILGNIRNFKHGESSRRFEKGLKDAIEKEKELLERLNQLPEGGSNPDNLQKEDAKRMIRQIRDLSGYREYPKFSIVKRYFIYKQALLKEAGQLLASGAIQSLDDIYYLTFEELREVVRTGKTDHAIINQRRADFRIYEKLTPPRVITSDGEIVTGTYKHGNLPPGAIVGMGVSSGIIEGRARVILNMGDANLEDGDILVTSFTDPSWTPLFVSIKGLVAEVGGLMTHGAVIAREYGLPAVVGVENATKLIKDGDRVRVNGGEGWVVVL